MNFSDLMNEIAGWSLACSQIGTHQRPSFKDHTPFVQLNVFAADAAFRCLGLHKRHGKNLPPNLQQRITEVQTEVDQAKAACREGIAALDGGTPYQTPLYLAVTESLQAQAALQALFET